MICYGGWFVWIGLGFSCFYLFWLCLLLCCFSVFVSLFDDCGLFCLGGFGLLFDWVYVGFGLFVGVMVGCI